MVLLISILEFIIDYLKYIHEVNFYKIQWVALLILILQWISDILITISLNIYVSWYTMYTYNYFIILWLFVTGYGIYSEKGTTPLESLCMILTASVMLVFPDFPYILAFYEKYLWIIYFYYFSLILLVVYHIVNVIECLIIYIKKKYFNK